MKRNILLILFFCLFLFNDKVFAKNYEISPQSNRSCTHPNAWYNCDYHGFQVNGTQQMAFTLTLDDDVEDGFYSFDILLRVPSTSESITTSYNYGTHDPVIMDQIGGQIGNFTPISRTMNYFNGRSNLVSGGDSIYHFYYINRDDTTIYTVHFDSIKIEDNKINLMFIIFYNSAGDTIFEFYDNVFVSDYGISGVVDELKETNKTIKSDDMTGGNQSAQDFKDNSAFNDNTGIQGIIELPLNFINSLSNACVPLQLTMPYLDYDFTIPCLGDFISSKVPLLANVIKVVVNGFIVYRILLGILDLVKSAKNPDDDRIEVLEL